MYSPERYAALVDAVEALEEGVCVTDRGGRVLYQNGAFQGLPSSGPDARALKEAIRDAQRVAASRAQDGEAEDESGSTSFTVETRTSLVGFRVRCSVLRRAAESPPRETIVIWVRPVVSHRLPLADLRHRFGLTAREGHVAVLLESGARTREIAQALGISIHTARRHAEAVLRKLDVHSRGEVRERMRHPA